MCLSQGPEEGAVIFLKITEKTVLLEAVVDSSEVFEGSEDLLAECLELRIHRIGNPEVFSFCFGECASFIEVRIADPGTLGITCLGVGVAL